MTGPTFKSLHQGLRLLNKKFCMLPGQSSRVIRPMSWWLCWCVWPIVGSQLWYKHGMCFVTHGHCNRRVVALAFWRSFVQTSPRRRKRVNSENTVISVKNTEPGHHSLPVDAWWGLGQRASGWEASWESTADDCSWYSWWSQPKRNKSAAHYHCRCARNARIWLEGLKSSFEQCVTYAMSSNR